MILKVLGIIFVAIIIFTIGVVAGDAMGEEETKAKVKEAKREYADAVVQDLITMYGEDDSTSTPVPYGEVIKVMLVQMKED